MKYSQACQVKTVVDLAINALERAARDGMANKASRKRLAAAYVSRPQKGIWDMADTSRKKNRERLEEQARDMCWSWNTEDINPDEDDGKVWVPVMQKTLNEEAGEAWGSLHMPSGVKEIMVYPWDEAQPGTCRPGHRSGKQWPHQKLHGL